MLVAEQLPDASPVKKPAVDFVHRFEGKYGAGSRSLFAATMVPASETQFILSWPSVPGRSYRIETNASLEGVWNFQATVPAAASPATSTSFTLNKEAAGMFYRIALDP